MVDIRTLDFNLLKAFDALLDERNVTRAGLPSTGGAMSDASIRTFASLPIRSRDGSSLARAIARRPPAPRTNEKKPRRHSNRRGQPMSEKFHGGDGADHIGRPDASQPSISAIQLRRARSRASGRRVYR
ncbi:MULTISPECIES: hypothetical protein [Burkholderia]|nr:MULTISPECIES: hypothetical protein [Burkholderia]